MRENNPVFGFFATMLNLRERFDSDDFVFCFDHGPLKRNQILPTYKERTRSPEHEEEHKQAKGIMLKLRTDILPSLGFKNIVSQQGYEADDLIAAATIFGMDEGDEAVIISADRDLYQLLSPNVILYNPNTETITNEKTLADNWFGLEPKQWAYVKAIAGCNSDKIPGIRGVGEKTAAKYVVGMLDQHIKSFGLIRNCPLEDFQKRMQLVKLPMDGTDLFDLEPQNVNWRKVQTYGSSVKEAEAVE